MLFPNKVKDRKWQTMRKSKSRLQSMRASRGNKIQYGDFALVAITPARVTSNQVEAARKAVSRTLGKVGKYWIRVFPDRPFTRKAAEVGMGKGKGNPEGFCFEVLPGRILYESKHPDEFTAREALRKAGSKFPVKTKIVNKAQLEEGISFGKAVAKK
jgi:large subunit ribosomal protein L16